MILEGCQGKPRTQWCKYARQCVGDAMYEQMMAIAERQKANRKLRKSEDNTHDQTDH